MGQSLPNVGKDINLILTLPSKQRFRSLLKKQAKLGGLPMINETHKLGIFSLNMSSKRRFLDLFSVSLRAGKCLVNMILGLEKGKVPIYNYVFM